jgi:hypothetical protein
MPQYAVESSIGVLAESAVFALPGYAASMSDIEENITKDDYIFGKYDPHTSTKNGEMRTFELNYMPNSIDLIKRGLVLPNGAGTAEETVTFIERARVNNILQYKKRVGALVTQQTGQINRGGFTIKHTYECQDISDWASAHGLAGTPNFVTKGEVPTTEAWSHLTPGVNPCLVDGVITKVQDITWEVNWTVAKLDPNGVVTYEDIEHAKREINLTISGFLKDNAFKTLWRNYNRVDVRYKINNEGSENALLFKGFKAKRHEIAANAGGETYIIGTISGLVLDGVDVVTV